KRADFEKRRAGIEQALNALARQQLVALVVARAGFFGSAQRDLRRALAQLLRQAAMMRGVLGEGVRVRIDVGFEFHVSRTLPHSLENTSAPLLLDGGAVSAQR